MKNATLLFLCFSVTRLYASENPNTIKIKMTFSGNPPDIALAWMSEDKSLSPGTVVRLDQKNKEFSKPLIIGPNNAEVTFHNSDDVQHNIFAMDQAVGVFFDVGMVPPDGEAKKKIDWPEDKVVRLGCKIHPTMKSYVANVSSKFSQIIEIPPGSAEVNSQLKAPPKLKKMSLWMPKFDPIEIAIEPGASQSFPLKRKGEEVGTLILTR